MSKRRKNVSAKSVRKRGSNITEYRINQTKEQQQVLINKLADDFITLPSIIQDQINKLRSTILKYTPTSLLYASFTTHLHATMGKVAEVEYSREDSFKQVVKEYVFNVLASNLPTDVQTDLTEEGYNEILAEVMDLYDNLFQYSLCKHAYEVRENPNNSTMLFERGDAEMRWLALRGKRYRVHEKEYLSKLLQPQENILAELYGITVNKILEGVEKIIYALTYNIIDAYHEVSNIKDDFFNYLDSASNEFIQKSPEDQFASFLRENALQDKAKESMDSLFTQKIIDAHVTGWNDDFLNALTWRLGEDTTFYSDPLPGWPIKESPSMKRPFIQVNNEIYCFDLYIFLDNLYRSIQNAILKTNRLKLNEWKDNQKVASEAFSSEVFQSLLPTDFNGQNLYYDAPTGIDGKLARVEVDEIKICGTYLLIIQVKAVAYKHFSPFLKYEGLRENLQSVIYDPFKQAKRLYELIQTDGTVNFYKSQSMTDTTPILSIKKNQFKDITLCCISIDNITNEAAKKDDLLQLGIDPDLYPIFAISIDDLLMCRDLLTPPYLFLHYISQRKKASKVSNLQTFDEIDHIAAYLTHINYVNYAESIADGTHFQWVGYQAILDEYYATLERFPEEAILPSPQLPRIFVNILEHLWQHNRYNVLEEIIYLLNQPFRDHHKIQEQYETLLKLQKEQSRVLPLHLGIGRNISIYAAHSNLLNRISYQQILLNVNGVMYARGESERLLLKIYLDEDWSSIKQVSVELVKLTLNKSNHAIIEESIAFRQRCLLKFKREKGRTPERNEQCPCGSEKKFKKCCFNI